MLNNLIIFCDEMMSLVDAGRALDAVYLNFNKVLITFSHNILVYKLMKNGLDKCIPRKTENCLKMLALKGCDQWPKVQEEAIH